MRVGLAGWSLQLHPDWDVAESIDRLLVSAAEEGGDLELKSSLKLDGAVTDEELRAAANVPERWQATPVEWNGFRGLRYGGDDDGLHMVWWWLACGPLMVRAFFNGLPRFAATEVAQAEAMLATLRVEGRAD